MNTEQEIINQKNIIAEALKQKRALQRERKSIGTEIKGWNDSMEKASAMVEMLEAGDVDGFQQTIASMTEKKDEK